MTFLALLRHGETAWSAEGRIQGRTDVPLSDAGRMALQCSSLPQEYRTMRVVSSPLLRCIETAIQLGLSPDDSEDRLAEMRWGHWEGRTLAELRIEFGSTMRENEARGLDFTPPNGESPRQVLARVQSWLADISADKRPTLAVTHRGVIRVILAAATNWDMRGRPPVRLDWNALHVFRLGPDAAPRVFRLNIHLVTRSGRVFGEPPT